MSFFKLDEILLVIKALKVNFRLVYLVRPTKFVGMLIGKLQKVNFRHELMLYFVLINMFRYFCRMGRLSR